MDDFENTRFAETEEETDKKCPRCGGVMDYDPKSGGLRCPYCDYEEEIRTDTAEPEKAEEMDFYAAEHTANKNWGAEKKTVICESCGAESIYDALQTSAVCPFCGSNQVMEAAEQDTIAPGGVVPFAVSDKQAADTISDYSGEYGIDHTHRDSKGNTHTTTSWHRTSGNYTAFFNDELVLASQNHDMGMLLGLEPFDTENNKSYKPEYIAGFVAERYSVGLEEGWRRAMQSIKEKLQDSISNKIEREHRADHTRNVRVNTGFHNITYKYLLLPVWISNFKYKDKVYRFMVNGQTGKVSGKTPISAPKVVITALGVLAFLVVLYIFYSSFTN